MAAVLSELGGIFALTKEEIMPLKAFLCQKDIFVLLLIDFGKSWCTLWLRAAGPWSVSDGAPLDKKF